MSTQATATLNVRLDVPNGYCQMIAIAWFLYDCALTFSDEIELIWSRKIRYNTLLFLLTRYLTMLLLAMSVVTCTVLEFSPLGCTIFDWTEALGTVMLFGLVQMILQLRIYIMYGCSRRILLVNGALFALEVVASAVITAFCVSKCSCFSLRQRNLSAVWVAPLAYETYLAVLAILKLWRDWASLNLLGGQSVLPLIVRDNVIYFLMIVAAMIANVICFTRTDVNPGISVIVIVHAIGTISGTRIVLSLLRGAEQSVIVSSQGPIDMTDPANTVLAFEKKPTHSIESNATSLARVLHVNLETGRDTTEVVPGGNTTPWPSSGPFSRVIPDIP